VKTKQLVTITIVILTASGAVGCASDESSSDRANRASTAIEACRAHDGVTAFDDDAVICADGTFQEERGSKAVAACERHGGVSAFDDDIVICSDQTYHRAEGG
jgi:hypothetical protein